MLRITVELLPHGDKHKRKIIGTGEIYNIGTDSNNNASYNCIFMEHDKEHSFTSKVNKYPRKKGFWTLIEESLKESNQSYNIEEIAEKYNLIPKDLVTRMDGRIEWICEHGVGHTIYSPTGNYIHGCDGCCTEIFNKKEK